MSRHDDAKFQMRTPRQWDAYAYIPSLQMHCVHRKNKENLDKNEVLKAIRRDKQ